MADSHGADTGDKAQVTKFPVDPLYDGTPESPHDVAVLTHDITGYDGLDYPMGTLRLGPNEYDGWSGTEVGDGNLIFDFDDGTLANDALSDLGPGAEEALVAPGDSGSPPLINGTINGKPVRIHSLVSRKRAGCSTEIDRLLTSSFGEDAGDVGVGADFVVIQSLLVSSPEPSTMFLIGIALVAVSLLADKTRHR